MDINDTYAEPAINEGYLPYWAKDDGVVSIYFGNRMSNFAQDLITGYYLEAGYRVEQANDYHEAEIKFHGNMNVGDPDRPDTWAVFDENNNELYINTEAIKGVPRKETNTAAGYVLARAVGMTCGLAPYSTKNNNGCKDSVMGDCLYKHVKKGMALDYFSDQDQLLMDAVFDAFP